jgi:muramoyltetrapeptide carboxypeptidase
LVGGNLSLVQALVGTPDAIATRGALVFLEDTGEAPYRIDRMLTHLLYAGFFDQAAGVLLGDFHADHTAPGSEHGPTMAVLAERLRELRIPVGIGFPFGHQPESWTLPYGARARLSVDAADGATELTLLQPAVRP